MNIPRIIAHRGASASAPENTIDALEEAWRQGASCIEVDVSLLQDGSLVLFHDASLDRIFGVQALMSDQSYATIQDWDAGRWFAPGCSGARVPLLSEALAWCSDRDIRLNLELKHHGQAVEAYAAQVVSFLRDIDPQSFWISSFDAQLLHQMRQRGYAYALSCLCTGPAGDILEVARDLDAWAIGFWEKTVLEEDIVKARTEGFKTLVYTINDVDAAKKRYAQGVDAIFTDRPGELMHLLK